MVSVAQYSAISLVSSDSILFNKGDSGNESVWFHRSLFGGLLLSAKSEIRQENPLFCDWAKKMWSLLETGMFKEFHNPG